PWGALDRVGNSKTAALLDQRRSKARKGSGCRSALGDSNLDIPEGVPPKGPISSVSGRLDRRPDIRRDLHIVLLRSLGRTLAWIVFASRAPARPPTVWDQRREAPVPGDAWSP
ncbi:MAG: hypothetical protein QMB94_13265, partial [Phycisphaerales bacterium]